MEWRSGKASYERAPPTDLPPTLQIPLPSIRAALPPIRAELPPIRAALPPIRNVQPATAPIAVEVLPFVLMQEGREVEGRPVHSRVAVSSPSSKPSASFSMARMSALISASVRSGCGL